MNSSTSSTKPKRVPSSSRLRRRLSPYKPIITKTIGLALVGLAVLVSIKLIIPFVKSTGNFLGNPLTALSILKNPDQALKQTNRRTNILVLGKGGAFHEAPDLTDTIMVVSLHHDDSQTNPVSLISLPRDIWINSMRAKLNSAYYYGQQKNPAGGGFALARDAVFQVTDLPIHYTLLVDFEGFKKAIDLVGGIEVEVERTFTDEKYPLEFDNGEKPESEEPLYETVHFEQGQKHLDGETALKFSRSRNSEDPDEGTDFARAKRQQQVLVALAQKLKTKETALSPERIRELRQIFDDYTDTDLGDQELLALGRIGISLELKQIQSISLNTATETEPGLLINPPISKYGQWVLESRTGNWSEIHDYIQEQLNISQ